jgi:hypothetical protein
LVINEFVNIFVKQLKIKKMKKIVVILVIAISSVCIMSFSNYTTKDLVVFTQTHDWQKIGQMMVNVEAYHDEIMVTATEGRFTKLKFKVLRAPIHVKNVKVVFGNGESKNVNINARIAAGTESKVIDLPGNKRIIRKIVINYKSIPGKGRAVVVVLVKH